MNTEHKHRYKTQNPQNDKQEALHMHTNHAMCHK